MLTVLIFLVAGIITGHLIRNRLKVIKFSDMMLTISIYLLLLLLGIGIGSNKTIIDSFDKIGLKAMVLAASGVLGSIIISYFVYKYFFYVGLVDHRFLR